MNIEEIRKSFKFEDGVLYRWFRGMYWRTVRISKSHRSDGYAETTFKGRKILVHRLVFALSCGEFDQSQLIDHIDGEPLNNNINNLRIVTQRQNQQNRKIHREGRLLGCSFHKRSKKWEARIHVNGKNIFLGYWDSQDEASDAYIAALAAAMPRPKKK